MVKKILGIILPALILSLSIGGFVYLRASRPEQPGAQIDERVWRVEAITAQPGVLTPTLTLYGQLQTPEVFRASAPVTSRVDRVLVREGEWVDQGQLLITLDSRDFLPELEQSKAEVAELEAQLSSEAIRYQADLEALKYERRLLELSRQGVDRVSQLQKKKLGSDSALDEARQLLARQSLSLTSREQSIADHPSRRQALEAKLQRARARVDESELDLERSQIYAPYAGILARVEVAEGNRVKENDALLSLYDPASLELRARIPAPHVQELQQTLAGGGQLQGELVLGADRVKVRLVRLAGQAEPSGIDAFFQIEVDGPTHYPLREGQSLKFDINRAPQESAVAVPFSAVYSGERVYTLQEGRIQGIAVALLGTFRDESGTERLVVRSPKLRSGDQLVVTHLPNAVDGLRAEVVATQ
ncbi:MAG: biotin/lipoyl-binding protein [Gammaproteobacteria bacterium]|nr:biotin/lipoyl-binding protein [Gammaproteobacteria bacterium]